MFRVKYFTGRARYLYMSITVISVSALVFFRISRPRYISPDLADVRCSIRAGRARGNARFGRERSTACSPPIPANATVVVYEHRWNVY